MAFCKNCNKTIPDNSTFCNFCGAPTKEITSSTEQTQNGNKNDFFDMPDFTETFDYSDIKENKIVAILSYIGILFLVPMFCARNSKFVRFHINQGFNLFLLFVTIAVLHIIEKIAFGSIIIISLLFGLVFFVLNLCCIALMILGIYNAASGKARQLPIIGSVNIIGKYLKKN